MTKKKKLVSVIMAWLKHNKITFKKSKFEIKYTSHPCYPQLISLTDTLDYFNISYDIYKLEDYSGSLEFLPTSFISLSKGSMHRTEIIEIIKKNSKFKINSIYGSKILDTSQLLELFTGIVLEIKSGEKISSYLTDKVYQNRMQFLYVISIIILILNSNFQQLNWQLQISFIFSLLGIIISFLILKKDNDTSTDEYSYKFCSLSPKVSCQNVFNSALAKGFIGLKLVDVVGIFFFYQILSILFLTDSSNEFLYVNILLHSGAICVCIFSIYYQSFVVKFWCTLCLSVSIIIFSQYFLLISIFQSFEILEISLHSIFRLAASMILGLVIWRLIETNQINRNKLQSISIDFYKIKRKKHVFNSILKQERKISELEFPGEMIIGSENPTAVITLVLSPTCVHCPQNFKNMIELKNDPDIELKIIIRFKIAKESSNKVEFESIKNLYQIFQIENENYFINKTMELLYSKNFEEWNNKNFYDYEFEFESYMQQTYQWIDNNHINYTPFIALNGYEYPRDLYSIHDIQEFITE
ncbi:vitamin K epoxide reductase family protein [Christiangramia sp. LLG6405-1]|uniref:vitamin K epoxide reductase family protein n=1 Tax=Christiangramia sp. LLG6405-1 TaxID=3160832 RepID=UPI003867ED69